MTKKLEKQYKLTSHDTSVRIFDDAAYKVT